MLRRAHQCSYHASLNQTAKPLPESVMDDIQATKDMAENGLRRWGMLLSSRTRHRHLRHFSLQCNRVQVPTSSATQDNRFLWQAFCCHDRGLDY